MQVKFKGYKEKSKINISMVIPTGEQKTVITMEMPQDRKSTRLNSSHIL